jgi:hypothetical protein
VEIKRRTPKTETTVKEEELKIRSGAGSVNIFKAIELTPSLNVQTDDAYGLGGGPAGGGGNVRLRGFDDTQIGLTIDDIPVNEFGTFYRLFPRCIRRRGKFREHHRRKRCGEQKEPLLRGNRRCHKSQNKTARQQVWDHYQRKVRFL